MKNPHRKHQQLMTELTILNARIGAFEAHMRKKRGKISQTDWENLVQDLKKLNGRKAELHRKIGRLP